MQVRTLSLAVMKRSARLTAAALAGILVHLGRGPNATGPPRHSKARHLKTLPGLLLQCENHSVHAYLAQGARWCSPARRAAAAFPDASRRQFHQIVHSQEGNVHADFKTLKCAAWQSGVH